MYLCLYACKRARLPVCVHVCVSTIYVMCMNFYIPVLGTSVNKMIVCKFSICLETW